MNRFVVAARAVAPMALAATIVASTFGACAGVGSTVPPPSIEPSAAGVASAPPSERAPTIPNPTAGFPTAAFGNISLDPISEETAARFQAILTDMAGEGGITSTVMTTEGMWSGAFGKGDDVRDVVVDSQFGIGSVTKHR
jgi:hypothetical protein